MLDPAANARRVGRDERAGVEPKWNIAFGNIKEGQERLQLLDDWLQTNNKGARWWRAILTLIESSKSVRQAVERMCGSGELAQGVVGLVLFGRRERLFGVMLKDLETAVGALKEELKKRGDPGKCCGEIRRKVQGTPVSRSVKIQWLRFNF